MQPTRNILPAQSVYDLYFVPGDKVEYTLWVKSDKGSKIDLTQYTAEIEFTNLVGGVTKFSSDKQTGISILDPKSGRIDICIYGKFSLHIDNLSKYSISVIDRNGDKTTLLLGKVVHITGD